LKLAQSIDRQDRGMARPALTLIEGDHEITPIIAVGDLVRTGDNLYPYFKVIAIFDGRAWVRDVQYNVDHVVPIAGLHKI
jgi:hypothetical protein